MGEDEGECGQDGHDPDGGDEGGAPVGITKDEGRRTNQIRMRE